MIRFNKTVRKSITKGQITLPKKYDTVLDNHKYCILGDSREIRYRLQNGVEFPGRLYQSANNTTNYYQFYIPAMSDRGIFNNQIGNHKSISIYFDLSTNYLHISLVTSDMK